MSPTTIIAIAVPVLVVLAGVLLFATARRPRHRLGRGRALQRDSRRDRGPVELSEEGRRCTAARSSGRPCWPAASRRRRSRWPSRPVAWVPPDEETLGVTRRQFFNRSIVVAFGLGLSGLRRRMLAFLWPSGTGGFGSKINVGSIDDIQAADRRGRRVRLLPRGPHVGHRVPLRGAGPRPRPSTRPPELTGMEAGLIALYQKCPHLGCRVPRAPPRSGSSVAATARSTTGSARRRAAPPPGAWTASPWRWAATSSPSTPAPSSRARRSAPTPPARRPRAPTRRRRRPLMNALSTFPTVLAASTVTTIGATIVVLLVLGLVVYVVVNLRGVAEVGAEIELAPNRKPFLGRRRARDHGAQPHAALGAGAAGHHRGRPAALLAQRARPAVGRRGELPGHLRGPGRGALRRGLAVPELPRPRGHRRPGPYTITDAGGEFVAHRQLAGAGAQHRAAAVLARRGRVHHQLRPAVLAHARLERRGGHRPAQPPAGQQPDRLPGLDPAHAGGGAARGPGGAGHRPGAHRGGRSDDEIDAAIEEIDYDDPATGAALFSQDAAGGAYACARCHTGAGRSSRRARTPSARPTPTSATSRASPTAAGRSAPT